MLKVEKVDFHTSENAEAHRTNKYEICYQCDATTVLRRGQVFKLSVTFDRPYQPKSDNVRIFFKCNDVKEDNPRLLPAIERTTVSSTSKINYEKDLWSIALSKIDGKTIHVLIRSPQIIPFATYKLHIDTNLKDNPEVHEKYTGKDIYFLFNPWMKGDEVYMADTKLLDEYVLNDVGKVYTYKNGKPNGRKWVFGQFGEKILPALKLMMSHSDLDYLERGNPVFLSREISRMLSSAADGGVLQGNWSGNFSGGTAPYLWSSSVPIFEDYYDNDAEYVCYGQCWVFSAITVTACRAIGIPCRSVTNYNSAHDTDMSMTIDSYIIPEDKDVDLDSRDSIWNFHVWNDAWMARYDLPEGYGGWQAIDATPQECDDYGTYQCGPCSLEAIKKGEIGYNYDGPFVSAEVNADVIKWTYVDEDTWKPISIDKIHVGKIVLTKLPFIYDPHGDNDFEDVTEQYKSPEGSKEERLAFYNAVKQCSNTDAYKITHESKVTFCFSEIDSVDLGNDFFVTVSMVNNDTVKKTISLNLTATSMYYNGCKAHLIKDGTITLDLAPGKTDLGKLRVTPDEYAHLLVDFSIIKIHCIAKVSEDNFIWAAEDKFSMKMPEISIKSADELESNMAGKLLFKVKNPLKKTLTKCQIVFECPGLGRNVTVPCSDIKAGEEVTVEHSVTPDVSGEVHLTAMFISDQLKSMSGKADLNIL